MSTFRTTDLYLSAFLKARGCLLAGTDGYPQVFFSFESDRDISEIVNDYFNDGQVPVQLYLQHLKALRSLCKNGVGRRG